VRDSQDEAIRESISLYFADREVHCPRCKYNLANLRSEVCPECGELLTLRLQLARPERGPLVLGTVALSTAFGFALIMLPVYVSLEPIVAPLHWLLGGECIVSLLLLLFWLRAWRRVRLIRPSLRWLFAFLCWLIPALAGFLFLQQVSAIAA
jgi:hypothetical protein